MLNKILVDGVGLQVKVDGCWRQLERKQLDFLALLVKQRGQVVSRESIMKALWPDLIVSDNSISQLVVQLRKLLNDNDKRLPKVIKTVPKMGYQLIATVHFPKMSFGNYSASLYTWQKSVRHLGYLIFLLIMLLMVKPSHHYSVEGGYDDSLGEFEIRKEINFQKHTKELVLTHLKSGESLILNRPKTNYQIVGQNSNSKTYFILSRSTTSCELFSASFETLWQVVSLSQCHLSHSMPVLYDGKGNFSVVLESGEIIKLIW